MYLFLAVLGLYRCSQAFLESRRVRTALYLRCTGFSLRWRLWLLSTGSRALGLQLLGGLQSVTSAAVVPRLNS